MKLYYFFRSSDLPFSTFNNFCLTELLVIFTETRRRPVYPAADRFAPLFFKFNPKILKNKLIKSKVLRKPSEAGRPVGAAQVHIKDNFLHP